MIVYDIPDELAGAYKGCGHAIAAVKNDKLVDLLYLSDLLPDFAPHRVEELMFDLRLAPTIAHLSSLGDVSIGICSCWQFCEI